MPRLPRVTSAEVLRVLRREGWYDAGKVGSHLQLRHASRPGKVTVQEHVGQIVAPKTLTSILIQAGMTVEEFISRL